jgi:hypothetical protein
MPIPLSLAMRAVLLVGSCLVWTTASCAAGLGLDELLQIVRTEPKLAGEIEVELRRRDLKVPEIGCIAAHHGNQWKLLGGARAAPYQCRIGDRTVMIDAERIYYDVNRRKLGQIGQVPGNVLLNRARSFRESNFRWTWSP